jgi:hypothetical protein
MRTSVSDQFGIVLQFGQLIWTSAAKACACLEFNARAPGLIVRIESETIVTFDESIVVCDDGGFDEEVENTGIRVVGYEMSGFR